MMTNEEIREAEDFLNRHSNLPFAWSSEMGPIMTKLISSLREAKSRLGIVEPEFDPNQLRLGIDEDMAMSWPVVGD